MNVQALLALLVAATPCVWAACPPGTFECGNRCIAEEYVCDGLEDCRGAIDESQDTCKGECKPGATFCRNHSRCIPDWMPCDKAVLDRFGRVLVDCDLDVYRLNRARADCNGYYECTDLRDERDCRSPERCAPTAFFCNGRCLSRSWLCDGLRHCSDVDDEANCTYSNGTVTSTVRTEAPTSTARTEAPTSTRMENSAVDGPDHIHSDDAQAQILHVHVNAGVRTGPGGGVPLLLVLVVLLLTG